MAATVTVKTVTTKARPVKKPQSEITLETSDGHWLCAGCLNRIAHDRNRFKYEGKDEFTFSNPEGIRFEIIIFSQAEGCQEIGVPTFEHTWFPEHAWSFCQCDRCQMHLGWFYTGPHEFVGLIRSRLVRDRGIWN